MQCLLDFKQEYQAVSHMYIFINTDKKTTDRKINSM